MSMFVNSIRTWAGLLLTAVLLVGGCAPDADLRSDEPRSDEPPLVRSEDGEGSTRPVLLFFGTSLTEGYGLTDPGREAWPARVEALADSAQVGPIRIVNAGLSGETTAGGVRRIDWVLRADPAVVVIELGANDGLRGVPVEDIEANLDLILERIATTTPDARIALVAMEAPPNMGSEYVQSFRDLFPRVAERWNATLLPFLLEGVAGEPELNQSDGIHPTAQGHRLMARTVWEELEPMLRGAPGG